MWGLKNIDFQELSEVSKVIGTLESKEEASKEFQIMFQALEEGIVLIKEEKIMLTNTKFTMLMQEAEGDSASFLDSKFLSLRQESKTDNDQRSLRSLLRQDPETLQD